MKDIESMKTETEVSELDQPKDRDVGDQSVVQPPIVWHWQTSLDGGGSCKVNLDVPSGEFACDEEIDELIEWFDLVLRRLKRHKKKATDTSVG